jgi:hypothetical protein
MCWKLYWKQYHFEIGFHHGLKKFYVEVFNCKKNKLEEERYDFTSLDEAHGFLRKFGYHNTGRFLTEELCLQ